MHILPNFQLEKKKKNVNRRPCGSRSNISTIFFFFFLIFCLIFYITILIIIGMNNILSAILKRTFSLFKTNIEFFC
jgi:hypothetical protein